MLSNIYFIFRFTGGVLGGVTGGFGILLGGIVHSTLAGFLKGQS